MSVKRGNPDRNCGLLSTQFLYVVLELPLTVCRFISLSPENESKTDQYTVEPECGNDEDCCKKEVGEPRSRQLSSSRPQDRERRDSLSSSSFPLSWGEKMRHAGNEGGSIA